jgi:TatD DNase family protein
MPIDTHCHLTIRFESDEVPVVLSRASRAGVTGALLIGYCPMHNGRVRAILDSLGCGGGELPAIAGTAGIHSHEADKFGLGEIDALRDCLARPDFVAIGETGLDFFRDYADPANQERNFAAQVRLAAETGFPIVIHSRDAFDRTMEILHDCPLPDPRGVFHCFGYGPRELEKVVEMGFFVSFAGMLTYPRSEQLKEACRIAPIDRILVETDSPFQVPQKAKNRKVSRNEPEHVVEVARKVAEIRGMDYDELEDNLRLNTMACFPRLKGISSWADAGSRTKSEVAD